MTRSLELAVGNVIGPGFLPADEYPATVVWTDPYTLNGDWWVFVVWQYPNGGRAGQGFLADADIPTLHTTR